MMNLESIHKEGERRPDRIMIYGADGIGKSTFACDAPGAVFVASEDGLGDLRPPRFPTPRSWDDVLQALESLLPDEEYETVVIDSLDWVEHLLKEHIQSSENWTPTDFDKYGRGYKIMPDYWRHMIVLLDSLRNKGKQIILVVHSEIKNFQNPAGEDYMRFVPKIGGDKSMGLWREWCDSVLFALQETVVKESEGYAKNKATTSGNRIVKTQWNPAWDAKNRWNLPEALPLSFKEYADARDEGAPQSIEDLRVDFESLIKKAKPDPSQKKVIEEFVGDMTDGVKVTQANVRLTEMIGKEPK